jgi:MraZ protein
VAVPAKLRRNAPGGTDQFVITLGLDHCLFLFTLEQWDIVIGRIKEVSFTNSKAKFLTRIMASNAEDVELDGQSRILLPQHLIEAIQLEKEVLFVGVITRIEIWRPDTFAQYIQANKDSYEQAAEEILL